MNSSSIQDRNGKLEEYLQLLHSMAFELERAMSAISQNSINSLEESVANQEAFSTRLSELADELGHSSQAASTLRPAVTADALTQQIHAASSTLQALNRRYATLLKFSSRSVAMMVSLFSSYQGQIGSYQVNSYQGQIQEGSGSRLKVQTWSCQM